MTAKIDSQDPVELSTRYGLWNSPRHFCWNHSIPEAASDDLAKLADYWVSLRNDARAGRLQRKNIKAKKGVIAEKINGVWIPRYFAAESDGGPEPVPIDGNRSLFKGIEVFGQAKTYGVARNENKWNNEGHSADFTDEDCPRETVYLEVGEASSTLSVDPQPEDDIERRYAERVIAQRLHQPELRQRTLDKYGTACAYCGLDVPEIVEAAHLIADAEGGAANVQNMRPMCPNHHRAYDAGLLIWNAGCGQFEPAPHSSVVAPFPNTP